jgi:hypothetical protein
VVDGPAAEGELQVLGGSHLLADQAMVVREDDPARLVAHDDAVERDALPCTGHELVE